MDTIFEELIDSYQNFRLSSVAYGLFVNEAETFVKNTRQRITQLQAEHDARISELENTLDGIDDPAAKDTAEAEIAELRSYPARVVDCEVRAFEIISNAVKESAAEVHRHKMSFCDSFAAASAELERLAACYSADSQRDEECNDALERINVAWAQISGEVNGGENDEHENL